MNVTILLIVLFFVGRKIVIKAVEPNLLATNIDVGDYDAPKADNKAGGGGGGGDRSLIDPNKGKLPKIEKDPITPPQPQPVEHPRCLSRRPSMCKKTFACPTTRICR